MSRKGPFDLWMGMKAEHISFPLEEISPFKFRATEVPKPHSAFEGYILQIAPNEGLSWIKTIGKNIDTSVYGIELKTSFEAMEKKLSATYGAPKMHDFLMHDSIWNEPKDWMQSLLSRERVLGALWSVETDAKLGDWLSSVFLSAVPVDTTSAFISIEYEFQNHGIAEAEIASLEDDAL